MADFCKACAIETFGEDTRDLAELTTKEENERDLYAHALCEGCGYVQVDCDGVVVQHFTRTEDGRLDPVRKDT